MLWVVVVIVIIAYIIWTEDRSQNCLGKPCQHSPPPITVYDSYRHRLDKVIYAINLNHTVVDWRRAVLAGLIVVLVLASLMVSSLDGTKVLMASLILILGYYLLWAWLTWTWSRPNDSYLVKQLNKLRPRKTASQPST